jgi:magnesium transporter
MVVKTQKITVAWCYTIGTMIERYKQGSYSWIDLEKPTAEEAREVMLETRIPAALMSDITTPTPRSAMHASASKVLKISIDYPVVKRTDIERPHDIKFFITKTTLVTAHYESITAFHAFKKEFEVSTLLGKAGKSHGGHVFLALMNTLYDALGQKLDYLEDQIEAIEHEIFREREKEMVLEISKVSRKLIAFKQALVAHGDVFEDARPHFIAIFGASFNDDLTPLFEHYEHIMRRLTALTESTTELRETNHALVSTKEGEVMKILTIIAFITYPLTLMSSIFGMNAHNIPIIGSPYDFYIIIGMMVGIALIFFVYFKYKKWF